MAQTLFAQVTCPECGNTFNVYTEDIKWESFNDDGESEQYPGNHEYHMFQKIICTICGHEFDAAVTFIGILDKGQMKKCEIKSVPSKNNLNNP